MVLPYRMHKAGSAMAAVRYLEAHPKIAQVLQVSSGCSRIFLERPNGVLLRLRVPCLEGQRRQSGHGRSGIRAEFAQLADG